MTKRVNEMSTVTTTWRTKAVTATITIELSITREAEVEMTTRKRKRKKTNIDVLGRWRLDRLYCLCWKSGVGYPILRGSREKNHNGNSERERESGEERKLRFMRLPCCGGRSYVADRQCYSEFKINRWLTKVSLCQSEKIASMGCGRRKPARLSLSTPQQRTQRLSWTSDVVN